MLLERQTQLNQLEAALAGIVQGPGRVVALTGEAGAGKTALVEAFASRLDKGLTVLRSACEDLSIPDPLGPLYDLARGAQWELPRAFEDRQVQRLPLFSEALDVFEAKGPSVLVIEDLHWADDATLDFVRWTTYQRVTPEAAARMASDTGVFADAEGLDGHARAARAWSGRGGAS